VTISITSTTNYYIVITLCLSHITCRRTDNFVSEHSY